jgi:hypothetical protein
LHWPKKWIEAAWQKVGGFKELLHLTTRAVPLLWQFRAIGPENTRKDGM